MMCDEVAPAARVEGVDPRNVEVRGLVLDGLIARNGSGRDNCKSR